MSLLTKNYPHLITHWIAGDKDIYGKPSWTGPFTIYGLWAIKQETIVDINGREIISKASVMLNSLVTVGDFILLGSPPSASGDPTTISGAWEVKAVMVDSSILDLSIQTIEAKL